MWRQGPRSDAKRSHFAHTSNWVWPMRAEVVAACCPTRLWQLRGLHWANERRPDGLGHAIEHDQPLTGAEGGLRLINMPERGLVHLPVVADPHVPGGVDGNVHLHLHPAANKADRRRDRVAHLHSRRAGFGPVAAQFRDWVGRIGVVGNPDMVVAVNGDRPWNDNTMAVHWRPCPLAVRAQDKDGAAPRAG